MLSTRRKEAQLCRKLADGSFYFNFFFVFFVTYEDIYVFI